MEGADTLNNQDQLLMEACVRVYTCTQEENNSKAHFVSTVWAQAPGSTCTDSGVARPGWLLGPLACEALPRRHSFFLP